MPRPSASPEPRERTPGALGELLGLEGIAKNDIATRSISIHPHYDDKGKVAGYEASNDVVVVLRGLARAGEVIDAAAGAVGDDIRMGALVRHRGSGCCSPMRREAVERQRGRRPSLRSPRA